MRTLLTLMLAVITSGSIHAFYATSPRNQYYIPAADFDKTYALMHLISDDESFATCDTLLLSNFMNVRHLEFLLSSRLPHKYEKIILRDALTQWESEPFPANTRNIAAYSVRLERGELVVSRTYIFFIRNFVQFLGLMFVLLFVVKGLVYWLYFKKKIRLVLGRFSASQVNASLLIATGMVICTSLLGAHISAVLFALLLLVATLLMFLWELRRIKTSLLSRNQHLSLFFLSNLLWFLVAVYPLMGSTPAL